MYLVNDQELIPTGDHRKVVITAKSGDLQNRAGPDNSRNGVR